MPVTRKSSARRRALRLVIVVTALSASLWWVLAAPVPKGAVLFVLVPNHGIDLSDLAAIPFLVLAGWIVSNV